MFTAISLHKAIISFCLGLEMFKNYQSYPRKAFLWMLLFAIMAPIGIGVGVVLTSGSVDNVAKSLVSSVLQGVSAGAFLYVTFLEILCVYMGHTSENSTRFVYILSTAVGFALMAVVKVFDNE